MFIFIKRKSPKTKNHRKHKKEWSFTIIELLVVVAIIGILATITILNLHSAKESAKISKSAFFQKQLLEAVELYFNDMDFYPPDVNRGWDPGFMRSLPWSPDEEAGISTWGPGTNCSHCPSNWQEIVQKNWSGPYIKQWPRFTEWQGKYDYNYWASEINRYGCSVPAGIYVGIQGNYQNSNIIPPGAEQKMIEKGFDSDRCLNGESQMLLWRLGN
ncbi:MAG: type II secretion system protein [Candidatus Yanofskybacteria bacterium]|nr:type II secretion system protein [Candidatus Yanofskybacteria bacterium]